MQQQEDLEFQSLLHQVRAETITAADVIMLNKQMIQFLSLSQGLDSVCVTIFNKHCHHINQLQIQHFAEAHEQSIYMFSAKYIHIKKVQDVFKIDELLATQNEEDTAKESDLFRYT